MVALAEALECDGGRSDARPVLPRSLALKTPARVGWPVVVVAQPAWSGSSPSPGSDCFLACLPHLAGNPTMGKTPEGANFEIECPFNA